MKRFREKILIIYPPLLWMETKIVFYSFSLTTIAFLLKFVIEKELDLFYIPLFFFSVLLVPYMLYKLYKFILLSNRYTQWSKEVRNLQEKKQNDLLHHIITEPNNPYFKWKAIISLVQLKDDKVQDILLDILERNVESLLLIALWGSVKVKEYEAITPIIVIIKGKESYKYTHLNKRKFAIQTIADLVCEIENELEGEEQSYLLIDILVTLVEILKWESKFQLRFTSRRALKKICSKSELDFDKVLMKHEELIKWINEDENEELEEDSSFLNIQQASDEFVDKIKSLIESKDENHNLEFKSTLMYDVKKQILNRNLEFEVTSTMSAFMNSDGGILLIGVEDSGNIYGLENDYKSLSKGKQNRDGFQLHLTEVIRNSIGLEYRDYFPIYIENLEGKDICIIEVLRANEPIFTLKKVKESPFFFIRSQTRTQKLNIKQAVKYILNHWYIGRNS